MQNQPVSLSRPVLAGAWVLIGRNPDLGRLQGSLSAEDDQPLQECVDHHLFQTRDQIWHLWGCIRGTAIGRLLYHWSGKSLADENWQATGEYIRACADYGESLDDWMGQEWIQSPYFVEKDGVYYMFYGGHAVGANEEPRLLTPDYRRTSGQICLMTSADGYKWRRYKNADGKSRVFRGPGEARDPCLLRQGDGWILYYAGYEYVDDQEKPGFYARTSEDLIHWSDYRLVHRYRHADFGLHLWDTECPHVVERNGIYYLFRTENYARARTHVFWSRDPFDFGIDDGAPGHYIGLIPVAAPEIILDGDGREYITSNHDLAGGTRICPLDWQLLDQRHTDQP